MFAFKSFDHVPYVSNGSSIIEYCTKGLPPLSFFFSESTFSNCFLTFELQEVIV